MKHLNFLIKPASSLCNMRCRYCFYADEAALRSQSSAGMMTREGADTLIREAFANLEPQGEITFSFQGGEPTLAGLDFFRYFMDRVEANCPRGTRVHYALQTNGLMLDKDWAQFLARHQVLVGISLDGTKDIHDGARLDASGKGTWNRATAALHLLQQQGVQVNLLCVVGRAAARSPQKIYRNLKKLGVRHLQFIACLDPLQNERGGQPWSLTPQAYGRFLCELFDVYYQDWKNGAYTSIRLFDDYVHLAMGLPSGTCATSGSCGAYYVIEGDGSVYPCDFYALDEWKMGVIGQTSLAELAGCERAQTFLRQGELKPDGCSSCPWYRLCFGGCKRDWVRKGTRLENYLCPAFQTFFAHAAPRLSEMAQTELRAMQR
ncbi:anaerobic sulfatase maturase [Subdoligranulum variabile]|uniref:anaerobic sulfatase maturase n=1 Tax=Subdoligranulum variabile TaxID=214851 RepID=UPI002941E28A|nr:anaerobic sulfatase maturase [Subdoligranulum variabile]